jgi:hypothetical protein
MATIIVLLGGVLGFGAAVTAYLSLDAGFVTALFIWALSGPVSAVLATLAMLIRRPAQGSAPRKNSPSLPEIA